MLRKLVMLVLVAAAVGFGLWRMGVLDEGKVQDSAAELGERAAESARRAAEKAAEKARDAVEDAKRR
jgi:hypothetical protein